MDGKINTVMGGIVPADAGVILPHEHLICNADALMLRKQPVEFQQYCDKPLSQDIGWWITHNPYSSHDNAHLFEEKDAVKEELEFFKRNGGGLVVDNTTYGIHPNAQVLANLSMATGVHVVAGTGYYVESSRPSTVDGTVEEFVDFMAKDIQYGCEGTGIKAGVVGELGCSFPLGNSEKRVLQAAAQVECDTGCPVIIHPGRAPESPFEIMRIYQEAGGHASRVVMSHMDRTISDIPQLLEFAELGCYVEYDLFGIECSYYQQTPTIDMPSDAERIQRIKFLIENGFQDKITASHDIHTKHRLMKYGGHGFSHILLHVVPKMLIKGISQENVDRIIKHNPQTWLTFTRTNSN
ncbi:phosphotriesterase-related protein-like [Mercenaria mercenaria]|uniref:phosphotriesterase-related protein-like n=1 Tax=Mercenaria mercenaria TaxID=6596 RepID=UPI001E1DFD4F|nr:phosphotriesterase-related protein-like [Mercenaria mercenaria]XP_053394274.1 phosphotriesterase-related protein-like [Mercenaria mercenaria]XP_053394275.1 phosphotriesterase-related protein-like [Mercenaria mercenaria]